MASTVEKIAEEAAAMTREERLALVRLLLDLDQPAKADEISTAWDAEIRARVRAVDDGRATGISYEQIKKEMTSRFGTR